MRFLISLLLLASGLLAQTRIHVDQMDVNPLIPPEERWCPRPAMTILPDRKTLIIGQNWSNAKPCYIHFNITPPAQVDPVSVSSFVEPLTIRIAPDFTGDDEVYVYALAPTFSPAANAKIRARVKTFGFLTCEGCALPIELESRIPRTFPPDSVPIGFAVIRGGLFLPKPDDVLSRQQVYIGPGAEMALRADQGGYWFEVSAAVVQEARMEMARSTLAIAEAEAVSKALRSAPPPVQQVASLEDRIAGLERYYMELEQRIPRTPKDRKETLDRMLGLEQELLMRMQGSFDDLQVQHQDMNQRLRTEFRVPPPSAPNERCDIPEWAADDRHLYFCVSYGKPGSPLMIHWVRFPLDRKWKVAVPEGYPK